MLPPFELIEPRSLDEASDALAAGGRVLAGGTNLFPDIRARGAADGRLVSLAHIPGLRGADSDGERVTMGALTTVADVLRDARLQVWAPSLAASARHFAGQMIRNAGTVGGNICYGSPSADLVPPLMTLDAEVTLYSVAGERRVPLCEFFLDYKKTVQRREEILTAVSWAVPAAGTANLFYKLGRRKGDAITVTGVAVTLGVEGGTCAAARIALGSVAPTVTRACAAEDLLVGETLTETLIEASARAAAERCRPIDDIRASAQYRRHTVHVLTRRLVAQAWKDLS